MAETYPSGPGLLVVSYTVAVTTGSEAAALVSVLGVVVQVPSKARVALCSGFRDLEEGRGVAALLQDWGPRRGNIAGGHFEPSGLLLKARERHLRRALLERQFPARCQWHR